MSKTLKRGLTASLAALMVAGVGATTNNVNARRRRPRYHRVVRRTSWYRGVPRWLQGRYYKRYLHAHVTIKSNHIYTSASYGDPMSLGSLRTRRLGGNRYRIYGHGFQGNNMSIYLVKYRYGAHMNFGRNHNLSGYYRG